MTSLLVSHLLVDILVRNQYTALFIAVASVVVAFLYWSMRPRSRRVKVEEE
ncbi:hypothetical protein [Alicyclobacillus sacchari]|uniref:hypothetical protein n=1 Tax=Alicyclobacillus sacchari TaxID=392010 RepID=UPI0024E0471A|nr:hypothetical protein [Alicyclobacillus sacchari]